MRCGAVRCGAVQHASAYQRAPHPLERTREAVPGQQQPPSGVMYARARVCLCACARSCVFVCVCVCGGGGGGGGGMRLTGSVVVLLYCWPMRDVWTSIHATTYGTRAPGVCQKNAQPARAAFASVSVVCELSTALTAESGYCPPTPMPRTKRHTLRMANTELLLPHGSRAAPSEPRTVKLRVRIIA